MSITTYSELKDAIANWIDRDDLTDRIPEFIELFESSMRPVIFDAQMETRSYSTTVSGDAYLPLPSDFKGMRRMQLSYGGVIYMMEERTPAEFSLLDSGSSGMPSNFTVIGNKFQFHPKPDSTYRIEMTYYRDLPALSDSNDSNWLLADYSNLYLYGALLQAAVYQHDDQQLARYAPLYSDALKNLKAQDQKRRYGAHPLRIRPY